MLSIKSSIADANFLNTVRLELDLRKAAGLLHKPKGILLKCSGFKCILFIIVSVENVLVSNILYYKVFLDFDI